MKILDMCCGSKMFYFNKTNPNVIFDFGALPFKNESFQTVVFDPPYLTRGGPNAWQVLKYGKLSNSWENDLNAGFSEGFRVLKSGGVLIF
jgi:tRNA G10  N-methylase Trm11